jgi:hypothetical protein
MTDEKLYSPNLIGNKERKMCGSKRRYITEQEAYNGKQHVLAKDPKMKVNIYQCPYCHYYHIGRSKGE